MILISVNSIIDRIVWTHIQASLPPDMVGLFRGRKQYPTQNVLAAVNFGLRFSYALADGRDRLMMSLFCVMLLSAQMV